MSSDMIRSAADGSVLLKLRVHPGAKRSAVNGTFGDSLKVDLQAPPVDGKANAALLKFLADKLGLPKSAVSLKSGESSRDKVVIISGTTPDKIISNLDIKL
ncbi:MAG: DUF167 domain-containing protein [Lentisphaerae bacterium]|nr:DUF167 domain-containing protein [Lentisphaerota bacterium]